MSELYAYVGRQAILAPDLKVVAYELLYRDSMENRAKFDSVEQASAATIVNAVVEHGLDSLIGDLVAYVNLPASFLLGKLALPLDPARCVLEVLEDVPVTPELLDALRGFKARGFKIALDDFELTDATAPLVPLADVIKLDVLNKSFEQVEKEVAALPGSVLLAEKVSTQEQFEQLRALPFAMYQGFFFAKPVIARTRRLPHQRQIMLQLLARLYAPRLDLRELERLLASDVGLTVRILRLASSPVMSRGTPIGTVTQAVQRLGTQHVAALIVVLMAAGFDDKPIELITQTLVRARLCERLASHAGIDAPDEMFTAGLLSLLDAILDRPLDEIIAQLPLTALVKEALQGGASRPARILDTARHQNRGDLSSLAGTGFTAQAVFMAWYEAVRWADDIMRRL